jgi:KUP system potassium uptake protein
MGQVYVGSINYALMLATMGLVVGFRSSSNLAAAYGIAVTLNMTITTLLAYVIARQVWGWKRIVAGPIAVIFLIVDTAFVTGNALKILHGGWVAMGIALVIFTLLSTWKTGRQVLAERLQERAFPLARLLERIEKHPPTRVPGTAVFMSGTSMGVPPPLLHNLEYNKVMHEQVILLTVKTTEVPHVPPAQRAQVERLADRFFRVTLEYGFMEAPDVPLALGSLSPESGLVVNVSETAFFLGRETLLATRRPGMQVWRERLFAFMSRNAQRATVFFKIPPERVVEIGIQVEL